MKMIGCNHFICHLFTECPYIASYENDYIIWCISILKFFVLTCGIYNRNHFFGTWIKKNQRKTRNFTHKLSY